MNHKFANSEIARNLAGSETALTPTIKANWSTVPVSEFVGSVATELPRALSWPATAYRNIAREAQRSRKAQCSQVA